MIGSEREKQGDREREREIPGEKARTIGREEKEKDKEKVCNPPRDGDFHCGRKRGCAPLVMKIFR